MKLQTQKQLINPFNMWRCKNLATTLTYVNCKHLEIISRQIQGIHATPWPKILPKSEKKLYTPKSNSAFVLM
jgi:hypothetical protein